MAVLSNAVKKIDVVVVNYNGGDYIKSLVTSLVQDQNIYMTVVDNASSDHSMAKIDALSNKCIYNNENVGFATACNQGAACGHADVIAFINPDCQIDIQQLYQLYDQLIRSQHVLMGCHVTNFDGGLQRGTWRRLPNLLRVLVTVTGLERLGLQGVNLTSPANHITAVNGACFIVKRSAFESVNGYDSAFPLHFEDLDLFQRLLNQGYTLGYAADVKVKHIKGQASSDDQQVTLWKRQGLIRYFEKHRPRWEQFILRLLLKLK